MDGDWPRLRVERSGTLLKEGGGVLTRMQQRFVELRGQNLVYYESQPDGSGATAPRGVIALRNCRVALDGKAGDGRTFTVTGPHLKKTYKLQAATTDDAAAWIEILAARGSIDWQPAGRDEGMSPAQLGLYTAFRDCVGCPGNWLAYTPLPQWQYVTVNGGGVELKCDGPDLRGPVDLSKLPPETRSVEFSFTANVELSGLGSLPPALQELRLIDVPLKALPDFAALPRTLTQIMLRNLTGVTNQGAGLTLRGLPATVKSLNVAGNKGLTGALTLAGDGMPASLERLTVSGNGFNSIAGGGRMDFTGTKLKWLDLSKNAIAGPLLLSGFPDTLEVILLQGNNFEGETDVSTLPPRLKRLDASDNAALRQPGFSLDALPSSLTELRVGDKADLVPKDGTRMLLAA